MPLEITFDADDTNFARVDRLKAIVMSGAISAELLNGCRIRVGRDGIIVTHADPVVAAAVQFALAPSN